MANAMQHFWANKSKLRIDVFFSNSQIKRYSWNRQNDL